MFATLKLLFVYLSLGIPVGLFGVPYTLLSGDVGWLYRASMRVAALGARAAGVRVLLRGLEHVPPGRACVFMSNHCSDLDPPVLLPRVPGRMVILLKKELMRIPLLGQAMKLGGFIPVERGSRRDAARETMAEAGRALRSGLHIVVFPEGTRSPDGRLGTFKKGPFFLARENDAPIVPVAISGTERALPKGSYRIRPGVVRVEFLPVIEAASFASREDLMQAVYASVAGALPPGMQPRGSTSE